jgi:DNA-binding PadR family transcriptional regulator
MLRRFLTWLFPWADYENRRDEILVVLATMGSAYGLQIREGLEGRGWYNPGAGIYSILHRMESDGWIESWEVQTPRDSAAWPRRRYRVRASINALPQRVREDLC